MSIHIKNGRVIDPSQNIDQVKDIFIEGNIIVNALTTPANTVLDAQGSWVVPGLIDLHVHLRDPGQTHKESLSTGLSAAAAGGFTTVVAMPNVNPCADCPTVINDIHTRAQKVGKSNAIQASAITHNRAGQTLVDVDAIVAETPTRIFTDDGDGVENDAIMEAMLKKSVQHQLVVSQHCEYSSISNKNAIHDGDIAKALKITGQSIDSEVKMVERDIALLKKTGGHLHVSHISTRQAIELVRQAKIDGLSVTAEVTPHHLFLTDHAVLESGTIAKVAPPLRPQAHVDACRTALADGTIDVIATDHAPHTIDDKSGTIEQAAFGLSGIEVSVPLALQLVKDGIITPHRMIDAMSCKGAALLGNNKGTLKFGSVADITIINPNAPYEIDPRTFVSKGRNTPFAGTTVPGSPVATIISGKIVWKKK